MFWCSPIATESERAKPPYAGMSERNIYCSLPATRLLTDVLDSLDLVGTGRTRLAFPPRVTYVICLVQEERQNPSILLLKRLLE